jgi:hypothetical protein
MEKYILYLMLFVTPAATLTSAEKKANGGLGLKDENKHVWTLQTVTQTEFPSHDACMLAGYELVQSVGIVMNLTARGWCICAYTGKADDDNGTPSNCPPPTNISNAKEDAEKNKAKENLMTTLSLKTKDLIAHPPAGLTPLPNFDPNALPPDVLKALRNQ